MNRYLALILVIGYTISLTVASLISLNGLPNLGSTFDDKIYHVIAYVLLLIFWYNFLRHTEIKYKIILSALIAVVYGIIIEVLQGALTEFRTPDVMDAMANFLGVSVGIGIILLSRTIKLN